MQQIPRHVHSFVSLGCVLDTAIRGDETQFNLTFGWQFQLFHLNCESNATHSRREVHIQRGKSLVSEYLLPSTQIFPSTPPNLLEDFLSMRFKFNRLQSAALVLGLLA